MHLLGRVCRQELTKERRSEPAHDHVADHTKRNEEDCRIDVHACECRDHGGTPKKQLRADQNVGDQGETDEDDMRYSSVPDLDDLKEGVAARRVHFGLAGKDGEHQDLDGGTGSVLGYVSVCGS